MKGILDTARIEVMHDFAFLPPKLVRRDGLESIVQGLSSYMAAHLEYQGVDKVIAAKTWPYDYKPTVDNLEVLIRALSDVMHDSLNRSIKLATWGAEFVKSVDLAIDEVLTTRSTYDGVESNVLARLVEIVAYLHEKMIESLYDILTPWNC